MRHLPSLHYYNYLETSTFCWYTGRYMRNGIDLLRAAIYQPQRKDYFAFAALVLLTLLAYFFIPAFLAVVLVVLAFFVFSKRLDIGLYVFALVSFFTNWQITITTESLRDITNLPLPGAITAPISDLAAIILGSALLVSLWFGWIRGKKNMLREMSGHLVWYILFIIWAIISAVHVYDHQVALSIKYVLRPMVFAYLAFLLMPYLIIQKRRTLYGLFATWTVLGFLIALYGLSSLFLVASDGFPRVTPYPIFGITPLGVNHNLLAEPLVALIPVSIFMTLLAFKKKSEWFPLLRFISIFMIIITLLTLSRAAWLALAVQAAIFAYYNRDLARVWWKRLMARQWILALVALPIVAYMAIFLTSSIVSSSNESRQTMLAIVTYYVGRTPWLGYGPGSFINIMGDTTVFIIEYGNPLDSHGFLQKILLENGIIGLILFLAFLSAVFRSLAKRLHAGGMIPSYLGQFVFMMAAGAVIFQLFNTSYFLSTMWLPIGVALTSARLLGEKEIV